MVTFCINDMDSILPTLSLTCYDFGHNRSCDAARMHMCRSLADQEVGPVINNIVRSIPPVLNRPVL